MIYLLIFIFLVTLVYFYDYKEVSRGKVFWLVVTALILICVAGLRYRIGIDSIRYEEQYRYLPKLDELFMFDYSSTRFAPGYIFLNSIARTISPDFTVMQFLQAIYVTTLIFLFFYKYSKRVFTCIFFYFCFLYLNFMCEVMREACAVATFLWSFPFFIKGKWLQYYLIAFVSFMLHTSAILVFLLPVCYLPGVRRFFIINRRTVILLIGVYIVSVLINVALFDFLKTLSYLETVQERAEVYSENDLASQVLNIKGIFSIGMRYLIGPFLAMLCLRKLRKIGYDRDIEYFEPLQFMVCMCLIMVVISIPIAVFYRYYNYFFPFAILAMSDVMFGPVVVSRRPVKLKFWMWSMILAPILFMQFYSLMSPIKTMSGTVEGMRYYPYVSRFNPYKDEDRERVVRHYTKFRPKRMR